MLVLSPLTALATCCELWRRVQVEAAWAAAAQVVLSGAAGPEAALVNGRPSWVDDGEWVEQTVRIRHG